MKNLLLILFSLSINLMAFSQQTLNKSLEHNGLVRNYILYVPASYDESKDSPLVLNFHGYGSNSTEQLIYGDFRTIADTAGFIVAHPMGTLDNSGTAHWNVGWGASTVDDVSFTNALIDNIASEYNINQDRVYSTGMSNGGFMSYKLACELSDRIAAIASVTGTMNKGQFNDCNPNHPMPVMEIHGTSDPTVPYNGANWIESTPDVVSYWADYNSCESPPIITSIENTNTTDGSTVEHQLFANGMNGATVEHFKILNGGHTWPGSIFTFPGTNYDINASKEIWRFFSKYDINGLIETSNTNNDIINENVISIYPNPTSDIINIGHNSNLDLDFQIYNSLGVILRTGKIGSSNNQISTKGLNAGMYYLLINGKALKLQVIN
jgi:polyhydroxybutyrate depolymerase